MNRHLHRHKESNSSEIAILFGNRVPELQFWPIIFSSGTALARSSIHCLVRSDGTATGGRLWLIPQNTCLIGTTRSRIPLADDVLEIDRTRLVRPLGGCGLGTSMARRNRSAGRAGAAFCRVSTRLEQAGWQRKVPVPFLPYAARRDPFQHGP